MEECLKESTFFLWESGTMSFPEEFPETAGFRQSGSLMN